MPRLTITTGSNVGAVSASVGLSTGLASQSVPALTAIATAVAAIAPGVAQRGAKRKSTTQTAITGRASHGTSIDAVTGAMQMGNRMPASIALAIGFGMLVIARPSAGQSPVSTMSTPLTR